MKQERILKADGKTYILGNVISTKDFGISCIGCKSKFRNFIRFCVPSDCMKWECQNCSRKFSMYALEIMEHDHSEGTYKISVYMYKGHYFESKEYALWGNSDFRELDVQDTPKNAIGTLQNEENGVGGTMALPSQENSK